MSSVIEEEIWAYQSVEAVRLVVSQQLQFLGLAVPQGELKLKVKMKLITDVSS